MQNSAKKHVEFWNFGPTLVVRGGSGAKAPPLAARPQALLPGLSGTCSL